MTKKEYDELQKRYETTTPEKQEEMIDPFWDMGGLAGLPLEEEETK